MLRATVRHQPRLFLSVALGLVVFLLMPGTWAVQTRSLIAWDAGIAVFLGAAWSMMLRADIERMRRRAAVQDENRVAILALVVAAAAASLVAIGFELHHARDPAGGAAGLSIALAGVTIVLSWCFTHTTFALHYAHAFYEAPRPSGLLFPEEHEPDYGDFLYFSFVVGMTCQVSDVQVADRALRRLVLLHGVLSFFFNTVILALAINLAAGAGMRRPRCGS